MKKQEKLFYKNNPSWAELIGDLHSSLESNNLNSASERILIDIFYLLINENFYNLVQEFRSEFSNKLKIKLPIKRKKELESTLLSILTSGNSYRYYRAYMTHFLNEFNLPSYIYWRDPLSFLNTIQTFEYEHEEKTRIARTNFRIDDTYSEENIADIFADRPPSYSLLDVILFHNKVFTKESSYSWQRKDLLRTLDPLNSGYKLTGGVIPRLEITMPLFISISEARQYLKTAFPGIRQEREKRFGLPNKKESPKVSFNREVLAHKLIAEGRELFKITADFDDMGFTPKREEGWSEDAIRSYLSNAQKETLRRFPTKNKEI